MRPFTEQVVLITGAASGIGRTTALAFAAEGALVAAADIDGRGVDGVAAEIAACGGRAVPLRADVTDGRQVEQLIGQVVREFGRLDIAFNNAGVEGAPVRTADVSEDDFDRIMSVNVRGVWLCMKYEIKQMLRQEGGVIINTASAAGLVGAHSLPVYAASKHAVVGLTRSAAVEYARKGLRINAVCPAVVRTPMIERAFTQFPDLLAATTANNPTRRLGEPEEVAAAVLWLASPDASFVNGVAFPVDGGLTAQ